MIIRNGGKIATAAVSFRNGKNCTLTIENGTLEFTDDANYAGLTPRYFDNQGTINISGGVISMANREFTNNGAITIDAASKLIVPELILGENSSITIDAANFTETSKVIELSGTESLRGKVTLVDAENKYNLFYDDADGDVFITDESAENISVNSAWAASKVGDVVGDGFIFGYNAFAGFNKGIGAAVYEAMQNGTVSTINSINETDYVVGESRYTYKGKVGQDVLRLCERRLCRRGKIHVGRGLERCYLEPRFENLSLWWISQGYIRTGGMSVSDEYTFSVPLRLRQP